MPVFHKAIFLRESDNKRTVEAVRLRESSPHQHVFEIGHVYSIMFEVSPGEGQQRCF